MVVEGAQEKAMKRTNARCRKQPDHLFVDMRVSIVRHIYKIKNYSK